MILIFINKNRLGTPELSRGELREATSTPIDNNDPMPVLLSPRNRSTPSNFMSNGFDAEIVFVPRRVASLYE